MDSMNRRPLSAGFSLVRRLSATSALIGALALAACSTGPATDTDPSGDDTTNHGIGTSPSPPTDDPPNPTPPPPSTGSHKAVMNDPTGCPMGTTIVLGTPGNDVLAGNIDGECFVGLGGDDAIFARGTHSVVIAGEGVDYVEAHATAIVRDAETVVRLSNHAAY